MSNSKTTLVHFLKSTTKKRKTFSSGKRWTHQHQKLSTDTRTFNCKNFSSLFSKSWIYFYVYILKKPNSELVIFGHIKFESDLPKRCFKHSFDPKNLKPIDYFQCADCNLKCNKNFKQKPLFYIKILKKFRIKGLCKNCMQSCHLGKIFVIFAFKFNLFLYILNI